MGELQGRVRSEEEVKEEFVALIAEFFGVALVEARRKFEVEWLQPGIHVATAWVAAAPVSDEEITRFYEGTTSYVYDLAAEHCRPGRRSVWEATVRRVERRGACRDVLMYGDGIGTDSILLARRGHRVTYFDLPSITADFARFRFEREGLAGQIRIPQKVEEIPAHAFDAAICIEVLEHLPDPVRALMHIHGALRQGGIALITESFESVGPAYPSHLVQNARYAGEIHRLVEDLGFANTYYNTNPINRPMEFTKVAGLGGALLREVCKLRRAIERRIRGAALSGGAA